MANPIIRIKTGEAFGVYTNNENISDTTYLPTLETGELAYNRGNNGLYIGYNGRNYLISPAYSDTANPSMNPETQYFHGIADSANDANVAVKLGTINVGSSTIPIYLNKGTPTQCNGTLDVNISKNAATATKWAKGITISINGVANDTTSYTMDGSSNIDLKLPKTLSGFTSISAGTLNGALAVEHITGILPLNKGGTGANLKKATRTPNAIIRYTSSADDYFSSTPTANGAFYATATNGSPTFGTLPVAQGGTGTTSQTPYRMIISSATGNSLISSNNFADDNHLYINHNPDAIDQYNSAGSSYKLYVNGISRFNGDISLANGTDITPEVANNSWLGSATMPFYEIISRRFYLFDGINAASYGGVAVSSDAGAATTTQNAYLQLGNNIATGTVNNAYGLITLYGHKNSYTNISKDITNDKNNNGSTTIYNNHLYLPEIETVNYAGEFVIHKNNTKIGSASLPIYVAASGLVTACSPEEVFKDFSETVDTTSGNGQTLSLTISDQTRSLQLSAATDTHGGIITKNSQTLAGDKTLKGNYFSQSTNPYFGFKDSSGVIQGYVQYVQSSDDFAIGTSYANGLQITAEGDISIPESRTITPRKDTTGSVGTSSYEWNEGYFRNLKSDNTIYITPSTNLYLQCGSSNNIYAHSILPESDMGYDLGNTTHTWKNIYAHGITLYDGTNGYNGGSIYTTSSNATTAQSSYAILGNSTSTGTAGNRYGLLRLYTEGSPYLDLKAYRYATDSTTTTATSRTIYLRDHGATAYLAATTTRSAVGSNVQPVYVTNSGVLTACKMATSGAWFNALSAILPDGVMEIGRYIDFHSIDATTDDYSIRIDAGTGSQGNTLYLPDISGQVVVHTNNTAAGSASLPFYIAASGKSTACTASSLFSDFTSSTNTLSITVAGQTRTATIINTVSNAWANGTTSGPTLTTTINGKAGSAVAIPVASASYSGVVTTGAQTFAGEKTINTGLTLAAAAQIKRAGTSTSWYLGRSNALIKTTSYSGYNAIASMKTTNGDWSLGVYSSDIFYFTYVTDTNFNAGTNTTTAQMRFYPNGTFHSPVLATSNHGTANPSGSANTGALYFKRV